MPKINPNAPAFAQGLACSPEGKFETTNDHIEKENAGLSILALFSGLAMHGLLSSIGTHDLTDYGDIAHDSVMAAKALIAELNKEQ